MMTNLGIADQQYVRQAQAKSATKAVKQEALNSIASKIGQNRLENRTLQTYANMFPDFSYDKNYRIRKTGAPADFNMPVIYNKKGEPTHILNKDGDGYVPINQQEEETSKAAENKAKAEKSAAEEKAALEKKRYGGLVRAFKGI
jgi:hypothetical protein